MIPKYKEAEKPKVSLDYYPSKQTKQEESDHQELVRISTRSEHYLWERVSCFGRGGIFQMSPLLLISSWTQ